MMISCGAKNKQEILLNNFFSASELGESGSSERVVRMLDTISGGRGQLFGKQPAGLTPAHLDSYHYYIPFD